MSRSAASSAAEWPTRVRPAAATASGLSTFAAAIRRPLSPIASSMNRVMTRRVSSWMTRGSSSARMKLVDLLHQSGYERNFGAELGDRKQAGAQAVVDVVGVVGDVVGDRRRLSLEAGVAAEIERLTLIVAKDRDRNAAHPVALGGRIGGVKQRAVVLHQPRESRLGEIEPVEGGVAALEFGDDAQRVAVVVEAALLGHAGVERVLAGMPEWRVAEIVAERDRFGEVVVEPQVRGRARARSAPLRWCG